MTSLNVLIAKYSKEIKSVSNQYSFFLNVTFNFDNFKEELYELQDVTDKIEFLDFLNHYIKKDIKFQESLLNQYSGFLKNYNDYPKINVSQKKLKEEINNCKSIIKDLKDIRKSFEVERKKYDSYLKIKTENQIEYKIRNLSKFSWQGTEKSILIFIDLLFNSGFISKEDFHKRYSILEDSFLNKKGEPFKNTQLSVSRNKIDTNESIKITQKDSDYIKFSKIISQLKKILES